VYVRRRRPSFLLPFVLVLLGLAGAAAAVIVADRGGGNGPARVVRLTVTRHGTAASRAVTTPATSPLSTATTTATSSATSATGGQSLALQGYAKMQAGDYVHALPLLEQAARDLQGTNSLDEAYNEFNLALSLAKTQGCSSQVLQLLDASQAIQGPKPPIDQLRQACTTPAAPATHGPNHPAPPGHAKGPKGPHGPKKK
jgi:hypothetical protein